MILLIAVNNPLSSVLSTCSKTTIHNKIISETEDQETLTVAKPVKTYSKKERSFVISDNEETGDTDHVSDEENDGDKPPSTPAFKGNKLIREVFVISDN